MALENFGRKAKEVVKKFLPSKHNTALGVTAIASAIGGAHLQGQTVYEKEANRPLTPKEVGDMVNKAGNFTPGGEGGGTGTHNLTNPDFAWTQNADSEKKTHAMLLGKYQKMGVAKGVSDADFQRAYENRDTDPTFDDWAQEYASKVNKPMPSGRVELVEVRKPLIKLTEEQKEVIKKQDTNYDLMPFASAWKLAKGKGDPVFEWKGNTYSTRDDLDYDNLTPGKAKPGDGGGDGGADGVPGNPREREVHKTTETHVESVKPRK